jgi:peptide/nickel transport system permease protein
MKSQRETIEKLIFNTGNWPEIERFYNGIRSMELGYLSLPNDVRKNSPQFKQSLRDLYMTDVNSAIQARFNEMESALQIDSALNANISSTFAKLKSDHVSISTNATPGKLKTPAIYWNGFDNQYHNWISSFLKGDFGTSVYERLPVVRKVKPALFWTLVLNLSAIFLAFAIAIPVGVRAAVKKGKTFDRVSSLGFFMLHSLPSFWIGTLLLIFFTTREYGMKLFAGVGLGTVPSDAAWYAKIWIAAPHLILPVFCLAYPALAFVSRQMRGSMLRELGQDYVRTARAKGLLEEDVIWKHAFRNALFPVITLIGSVFPAAIAGSVAVEYIFNIPGMGWLTLNAILQKDWPIVFTVLMLGAVLTTLGMLVADVLYALNDPRVKFDKQ